jgi:hypothetical protein
MALNFFIRILLLAAICVVWVTSNAQQKFDGSKLVGKWAFERYEFIDKENDTTEMKRMSEGLIITFGKENKFVTTQRDSIVTKGTYRLSSDGKFLIQNEQRAKILQLDQKQLVFKFPEVIIHLKRLN